MKVNRFLVLSVVASCMASCIVVKKVSIPSNYPSFYKEGHRGTRGLMPENTIPAMKKGVEVGANCIEVDVYLTKDGKVLIAHDPFVNVTHSLYEDGSEIAKGDAKKYIWHQMNYEDIRKFDVGSKPFPAFPQQQKIKVPMPLLGELIDSVEAYVTANNLPKPIYNIELKTSLRFDSLKYNASPAEVVKAVLADVAPRNIGNRFYIQSFDVRPLQYVHKKHPGIVIGYLTTGKNLDSNLKSLGFIPHIYSPEFSLVNKAMADICHSRNMKLVPWTVNDKEKMKNLIADGVDGIITDYPNYFAEIGK
ncbi:glycerophosphodiester phosphodiesterase [Niastella caeni]|uniref:Glycerophosphodiester phosphodiesterase n=1 Tax=Niastella caeni TaxID=2569763 RepID=A0A4S8HL96_9BACT|nr:glycerophosphodiester phosphodiesterase family protein [Niastella caeni]THU36068.1 glycerophosphodiester phosphodiesterase [Niastella caeni]